MLAGIKKQVRKFATRNEAPILTYHGVIRDAFPFDLPYQIPEARFREHMRYVSSNYRCVGLDEVCDHVQGIDRKTGKNIAITFDDGFANNLHRALPILEEFSVPATVFVTSGYIGKKRLLWPERLACALAETKVDKVAIGESVFNLRTPVEKGSAYRSMTQHCKALSTLAIERMLDAVFSGPDPVPADQDDSICDDLRLLDWDELETLARHELISVGSHTVHHHRLSQIEADDAIMEIDSSRRALESRLGCINYFAYPFGGFGDDFDAMHVELVRSSGYQAAFAIGPGGAFGGCDIFRIPRRNITSELTTSDLDYLLSGGGSFADAAGAKLIASALISGVVRREGETT